MRITWRRPAAGELDGELLALALLAASGIFAGLWLTAGLPTPGCSFRAVTGLPCITCGGTRCLREILAGHVGSAFRWNPLVFLGVAAAGVYAVYAALVLAFRLPRIHLAPLIPPEARALRIGLAVAVAANWIYLIIRFSRGA